MMFLLAAFGSKWKRHIFEYNVNLEVTTRYEKIRPHHISQLSDDFLRKMQDPDFDTGQLEEALFDHYRYDVVEREDGLYFAIPFNPRGKWDWYKTSGNFTDGRINFKAKDWPKEILPHAYLTVEGVWHNRDPALPKSVWHEHFINYLKSVDPETSITAIDCHD